MGVGIQRIAGPDGYTIRLDAFFFFQAEDGIRDLTVTGVQTCALPISASSPGTAAGSGLKASSIGARRFTSLCEIRSTNVPARFESCRGSSRTGLAARDRKSVV